jgi:hypothetical protein
MTRTRRMDQISAENQAKTRAGKARAVAKRRLVMESVTIPVLPQAPKRTRRGAAKPRPPTPDDAPSTAAASRPPTPDDAPLTAAAPRPPTTPDDVPSTAAAPRPPTPDDASSTAAAPLPLAPDDRPSTAAAPRPPTPDDDPTTLAAGAESKAPNERERTVLRDGWLIIKRYSHDEVGAEAVSRYLKTVMDPTSKAELNKGFADAMECDHDEAHIVNAMIDNKLKELRKFGSILVHSTHYK